VEELEAILEKNASARSYVAALNEMHSPGEDPREGKEGMPDDIEAVPRVPLDVVLPPELLRRSFENLGFGDLCSIATTATVSREECRTLLSGFFARLAAEFHSTSLFPWTGGRDLQPKRI
jgi:hypothetical protein